VREGVENDLGFDPVLVMERTSGSRSNFEVDGGDGEDGRMVMVEASISASGWGSVSEVVVAAREEAEAEAGATGDGAAAAGEGVLRARPKVDSQPDVDEVLDGLPLVMEAEGGETTVDVAADAGSGLGEGVAETVA
jgi:hypothetical protein